MSVISIIGEGGCVTMSVLVFFWTYSRLGLAFLLQLMAALHGVFGIPTEEDETESTDPMQLCVNFQK